MDWTGDWTLLDLFNKTFDQGMYPSINNLIESQINYVDHIRSKPSKVFARNYSELPTRGRVYSYHNRLIGTSDNEACCGFYQEIYRASWLKQDLFDFFIKNNIAVSARIDEDAESLNPPSVGASAHMLRGGPNSGNPFRSINDLKLSHYLAAAEGIVSTESIEVRAARFLSPLNICLTPKTKKKSSGYIHKIIQGPIKKLNRNDIGETTHYLNILHALLIEKIISAPSGVKAYQEYFNLCSAPFLIDVEFIKKAKLAAAGIVINFSRPPAISGVSSARKTTQSKAISAVINSVTKTPQGKIGFQIGCAYTTEQIKNVLGGTIYQALSSKGGTAIRAQFNCGKGFNPEGPEILGIHKGPKREQAVLDWLKTGAIPYFFRNGAIGPFEYLGMATAEISFKGKAARDYCIGRNYPDPNKVELILNISFEDIEDSDE